MEGRGLQRLEPLKLLNRHHDHDRSSVLLDSDGRSSRKVNETAETVLGVFRRHVSHEAPDAAFGHFGQIGLCGNFE